MYTLCSKNLSQSDGTPFCIGIEGHPFVFGRNFGGIFMLDCGLRQEAYFDIEERS